MENQTFYESLLEKIKGYLNFKETQELKSLKKENVPVLEKKIQKLKKQLRFAQIIMFFVLLLIVIISFILQLNILPKLHRFFVILLMYLPITLGPVIFGKASMVGTQKKIDTFELMLILTKNGSDFIISGKE